MIGFRKFSRLFLLFLIITQSARIFSMTLGTLSQQDWKKIETKLAEDKEGKSLNLPPIMGVAIAEHQNSGSINGPESNWAYWEKQKTRRDGKPTIKPDHKTGKPQVSGKSCDFWNLYKQDIDLMYDFGFNACRLSLDWSKIQPRQENGADDGYDQDAIQHYHDVIDSMLARGISPMVTLHHFTHPQWFEEKGAFEYSENIFDFVSFSTKMFAEYAGKVKLWCTINEPGPYYFQGYINGEFPPAYTLKTGGISQITTNLERAGTVLGNLLKSHVSVYRALKHMQVEMFKAGDASLKDVKVGLVHQYLTYESYHARYNPLTMCAEFLPVAALDYFFNTVILRFLETGKFLFRVSPCYNLEFEVTDFKKPSDINDFIGLNYYSRVVIHQSSLTKVATSCMPGEEMTQMPYPLYAEGLFNALVKMSKLGLPIYITENGVAPRNDSTREERESMRDRWIKRHLHVVSEARKAGIPVMSYIYWTFTTNFEWNDGYNCDFGLYGVDLETQKRTLYDGAQWFKGVLNANRDRKKRSGFAHS